MVDCEPPLTQPDAPNTRSFHLNSREAHDAMCEPPDPNVWAGALPREPRWPRPLHEARVSAADDEAAGGAFHGWLAHVEAGRIGREQ